MCAKPPGQGNGAPSEVINVKKSKELDHAASILRKLLMSEGSKQFCEKRLREVQRELEKGGPKSRRRLERLIREISQALCDEILKREQSEGEDD